MELVNLLILQPVQMAPGEMRNTVLGFAAAMSAPAGFVTREERVGRRWPRAIKI